MGEATNKINTGDWDEERLARTEDDDIYTAPRPSTAADEADENPEQLRAGIEDTRAEMTQTINEIQERLSPEYLMGQVKDTVREATVGKVEQVMQKAGETIAEATEPAREAMGRAGTAIAETGRSVADRMWKNPIPVALIGLGLGMIMVRTYRGNGGDYGLQYKTPRRPQYLRGDELQYGESVGVTNRMDTHTSSRTGTSTGADTLNRMKETASDFADRSTTALSNLGSRAKDTASTMGGRFSEVLRDNPLVIGAVAVAAGTAVGLALPSTRFEHEYIGEASERLVDKAQEVAREAIDKVQNVAQQQMSPEGQPGA